MVQGTILDTWPYTGMDRAGVGRMVCVKLGNDGSTQNTSYT